LENDVVAIPKPKKNKDRKYLNWVKEHDCIFGHSGPCDPHHLPHPKNQIRRSDDYNVIPLCRKCHIYIDTAAGKRAEKDLLTELLHKSKSLRGEYENNG